jgi:hypothetical protein
VLKLFPRVSKGLKALITLAQSTKFFLQKKRKERKVNQAFEERGLIKWSNFAMKDETKVEC